MQSLKLTPEKNTNAGYLLLNTRVTGIRFANRQVISMYDHAPALIPAAGVRSGPAIGHCRPTNISETFFD